MVFRFQGCGPHCHALIRIGLLLWLGFPLSGWAEPWLLVDTEALTLELFDGRAPLLRIEGISIGRGGTTRDKRQGDRRTPLGSYRVAWFNPASRFHLFVGLDYPKREQVERAFAEGAIDEATYKRLLKGLYNNRSAPQDSALGGLIGIHGLGRADPRIHAMANWTEGCIALTDAQIDRLRPYLRLGTPVLIR